MNARTGPCTRCLGALGLSVSLGIAASAVAAPVVYRNGDGAWFNCKRYLVCENRIPVYLDVSLAPGRQTGQNTGRSIKHSFSCDPACWCCPVSEDWDANGVGAQICMQDIVKESAIGRRRTGRTVKIPGDVRAGNKQVTAAA